MSTVLNPLAYKDIRPTLYYWFLLGTRNRIHYRTFLMELQKAAIRENPGRETGRRNGPETVSFKTPQSGKIREASGKRNGKRETDYQKTRSPGRSGKYPGRETGRDVSTVSLVFVPFPSVSTAPDVPNPDHVSISWSKVATREVTNDVSGLGGPGTHFLAREAQVAETVFSVTFYGPFLVPFPGISKSRSPGRSGKVPGRFPGRAIISHTGWAQELKMDVIYIHENNRHNIICITK